MDKKPEIDLVVTCAAGVPDAYAEVIAEALRAGGLQFRDGGPTGVRAVVVDGRSAPADIKGLPPGPIVVVCMDHGTTMEEWIDAGAADAVMLTSGIREMIRRIRAVAERAGMN